MDSAKHREAVSFRSHILAHPSHALRVNINLHYIAYRFATSYKRLFLSDLPVLPIYTTQIPVLVLC